MYTYIIHTQIYAYMYKHAFISMHTCTQRYLHMYKCVYVCVYMHTHSCPYIHTHAHTCPAYFRISIDIGNSLGVLKPL